MHSAMNVSHAASVLGEAHATYGGLFVVMGIPGAAGCGEPAYGGRLFGVTVDDNPGLFGGLAVACEAGMGGPLSLVAQRAGAEEVPAPVHPGDCPRLSPAGVGPAARRS